LCVINKLKFMAYYDWENIVRSKSDHELFEFLQNRFIDTDGILIALDEMKRRKFDQNKIRALHNKMIHHFNQLKIENEKITVKENSIKYSPYTAFSLGFVTLIQFSLSDNHSKNSLLFIVSIVFMLSGAINIFLSKYMLAKIQAKREKSRVNIDKIINKINEHNRGNELSL
jgi:hypothetical protein